MSELRGGRFGELYAMHSRVMAYVRSCGADRLAVEDVVAETYLIAWRRLDQVPADDDAALHWLFGVARRVLANVERSSRRATALVDRVVQQRRPEGTADADERHRALEAWWSLRAQDRMVLLLDGWHGVGLDELAGILGCSRGAAAMRLSRSRERLAELDQDPV